MPVLIRLASQFMMLYLHQFVEVKPQSHNTFLGLSNIVPCACILGKTNYDYLLIRQCLAIAAEYVTSCDIYFNMSYAGNKDEYPN